MARSVVANFLLLIPAKKRHEHLLGEVFFFVSMKHLEIKFCKFHLITDIVSFISIGLILCSLSLWFARFPSSVSVPSPFVKRIKPDLSLFKFCFVVGFCCCCF